MIALQPHGVIHRKSLYCSYFNLLQKLLKYDFKMKNVEYGKSRRKRAHFWEYNVNYNNINKITIKIPTRIW